MTKYFRRTAPIFAASIVALLLTFGALAGVTAAQSTAKSQGGPMPAGTAATHLMDINSASKADLSTLPGIGEVYSQKIVDGRPYHAKTDLKTKGIIPAATYSKISSMIVARQATGK